jgi:hypothetical protein
VDVKFFLLNNLILGQLFDYSIVLVKNLLFGWVQWLILVIPATWEAEIRKITVQCQPRQKVSKTPCKPIAGPGGVHLSSQLWEGSLSRRHREGGCNTLPKK